MAGTSNAERVAKSAGVKTVGVSITDADIISARKARLEEIKREHEHLIKNTVPLKDIGDVVGTSADMIKKLATRHGIDIVKLARPEYDNHIMLSTSNADAERIMVLYYGPQ